jgi:hypothetical protein
MNEEQNIEIAGIQSETQNIERRDTRQEHESGSIFFFCHMFALSECFQLRTTVRGTAGDNKYVTTVQPLVCSLVQ